MGLALTVEHAARRIPLLGSSLRAASPLYAPIAARIFAAKAAGSTSIEQDVGLAFGFRVGAVTIRPAQDRREIEDFLAYAEAHEPRVVVEIGTANGGTLFLLSRVTTDDGLVVSIDLPGGSFGGGYPSWRGTIYSRFARAHQKVVLLRADSHSPETLASLGNVLSGLPIDLLFIDGDHSYDGVRQDFELYSPLVRQGGLIAFHDIVPGSPKNSGGVPAFWDTLRSQNDSIEFVRNSNGGRYGIGVLLNA